MYSLLELGSKSEEFSKEEIRFIKSKIPKQKYNIRYSIYNKTSSKNLYIAFVIDTMRNSVRRSGVENSWTTICERDLTNIEYDEMIKNFGTNNRRFKVYYYRHIEHLILEDKKYNIDTPEEFILKCKSLGYTGDFQLKMEI